MRTLELKGGFEWLNFAKAYPIPNGTASTILFSCPREGAKRYSGDALSSGTDFHALAKQKECQIIMGHLMPDHVHMCIAIPPKQPVASVMDS